MKIEILKTEITSSLFQKELNTWKYQCAKLMKNSNSNGIGQIDNLRKEIENKDKIISKLSATLSNTTNNLF